MFGEFQKSGHGIPSFSHPAIPIKASFPKWAKCRVFCAIIMKCDGIFGSIENEIEENSHVLRC